MTDILDDVPLLLNCPADDCQGEIRTTFGKLKANPEVTCPVCRVKANAGLSDEDLAQARAALATVEKPGAQAPAFAWVMATKPA